MDEPIKKAGQYPNVSIMAGTDPEKVKKFYGVKPSVFDGPEREPARAVKEVDSEHEHAMDCG